MYNQLSMDRDVMSENMTDTTIILPLTLIAENSNNHYYYRMNKHPFPPSANHNGKRIENN